MHILVGYRPNDKMQNFRYKKISNHILSNKILKLQHLLILFIQFSNLYKLSFKMGIKTTSSKSSKNLTEKFIIMRNYVLRKHWTMFKEKV